MQGNFDVVREDGHLSVKIERDELAIRAGHEVRHGSAAGAAAVHRIRHPRLHVQNPHFERITRHRALDEDRPSHHMALDANGFYILFDRDQIFDGVQVGRVNGHDLAALHGQLGRSIRRKISPDHIGGRCVQKVVGLDCSRSRD